MMFNRKTRSFLSSMSNSSMNPLEKEKRETRKRSIKKAHDQKSRRLSRIDVGQSMFFQHTEEQNWKLGKVADIMGPNTHEISGSNGGTYRQNRMHMRPTSIEPKSRDLSPVMQPRVLDVTPLTSPDETREESNAPKDPSVGSSQPCSVNKNITTIDSPKRSLSANRPRREIKPPIRFRSVSMREPGRR